MLKQNILGDFRRYGRGRETHIHEYIQVVLPVSGQMEIVAGGKSIKLNPSRAIIIGPETEHDFQSTRNGIFFILDIKPDAIFDSLNKSYVRFPAKDKIIVGNITPPHQRLIRFLAEEFYRSSNNLFKSASLLESLVDLVDSTPLNSRALVGERDYWDFGMSEAVQTAAKNRGMSESSFRRAIRRSFGDSPKKLQMEERLSHAEYLLLESDRPISAIAYDVGFQSGASFTNAFRRRHSLTPSDYRTVKRSVLNHAGACRDCRS